MRDLAALTFGLALAAGPAWAIDPGTATGHYSGDGVTITVTHAIALSMDNAEGQLETPQRLRVLLSEQELPEQVLEGAPLPAVLGMAREGKVRGLLVDLDPTDRSGMYVTILAKPGDPRASMPTITLSNTEGVWKRLDVSAARVAGEARENGTFDLAFSFSAPVFNNPVQQDLKGAAVAASEPVKALLARTEALGKGDWTAAAAWSTEESIGRIRSYPPEIQKQAKAMVPEMLKEIRAAKRVVIRRDTAAVETPDGSWSSLVLVNGAWKVAD